MGAGGGGGCLFPLRKILTPAFQPALKAPVSRLSTRLCAGFSRKTCLYNSPVPTCAAMGTMREPCKGLTAAPAEDLTDVTVLPRREPRASAVQSELQLSGGHDVCTVEGAFLHPQPGW